MLRSEMRAVTSCSVAIVGPSNPGICDARHQALICRRAAGGIVIATLRPLVDLPRAG